MTARWSTKTQKNHATIGIIGGDDIFVTVVVDVGELECMKEGLG